MERRINSFFAMYCNQGLNPNPNLWLFLFKLKELTPLEQKSGSFSLCEYSVLCPVGSQTVEKGGLLGECKGT